MILSTAGRPEITPLLLTHNARAGLDEQRESEAQFRELMAHLHQVFWMKNVADTAVLYISPAYENIWGRARASLYDNSHTLLDSVHPDDHARIAAAMSGKHETEGYEEEYRILRPDGTTRWIWARTYPVRDEQGEIKRYAGVAEDISERKRAEKEKSRLAAIIELSDDAIVSTTLEGIIIGWNNGAERKYGYVAEEILGHSILRLIPSDQSAEYLAVMKKVRRGEPVAPYSTIRVRKDGTLINFSVGIAPIEALDGEVVGVSKVGHEINRVKKLETELIEAQKREVLGQLTGGVAHDFNNILAVILGYSELSMEKLAATHPLRPALASIRQAAQRGASLTRQLLVFSRKEIVQMAVLDLNDVLKDMEKMLRQLINEDIELTIVHGMQDSHIKADLGYIEQVLMNLVVNARDAMPRGGKLVISTADVTLDENTAANPPCAAGDYVVLSIDDTGTGMTDAIKARLFEPFFTTKPLGKGTGLGLATCQTIVQQCGGHIVLRSEVGQGSTFKIYFPRTDRGPSPAMRLLQAGPLPRGTEMILIVEDNAELRHLVCAVLRAQGYEVLAAANGEEGVRIVLNNQGPAVRLAITDVIMPQMGGKEMAKSLELILPGLKVLFTSGYTDDAIAHHGVLDPDVAFLHKPYSIATLIHKVRDLLDAPLTADRGVGQASITS